MLAKSLGLAAVLLILGSTSATLGYVFDLITARSWREYLRPDNVYLVSITIYLVGGFVAAVIWLKMIQATWKPSIIAAVAISTLLGGGFTWFVAWRWIKSFKPKQPKVP